MRNLSFDSPTLLISVIIAGLNFSYAQNDGIAKSLGMYVFPNDDQDQTTQDADESACYKWAIQQTGYLFPLLSTDTDPCTDPLPRIYSYLLFLNIRSAYGYH